MEPKYVWKAKNTGMYIGRAITGSFSNGAEYDASKRHKWSSDMELGNLDYYYDLTLMDMPNVNQEEPGSFTYISVGNDGGYARYIQSRRPGSTGFVSTKWKYLNDHVIEGVDTRSTHKIDVDDIAYESSRAFPFGVELYMGDELMDGEVHEYMAKHILLASKVLKDKRTMVMRVPTVGSLAARELVYIMTLMFEDTWLYKAPSLDYLTSELYVVGVNYDRSTMGTYDNVLTNVGNRILERVLPDPFHEWIESFISFPGFDASLKKRRAAIRWNVVT